MFRDPEQVALWGELPSWQPFICLSSRWDLCALIDEEDYEWARQWKWGHTIGSGNAIRDKAGYVGQRCPDHVYAKRTHGRNGTVFLHREITKRKLGLPPTRYHISDHRNGDTLDCRRINLRWATLSMNAKNLFGQAWLKERGDQ